MKIREVIKIDKIFHLETSAVIYLDIISLNMFLYNGMQYDNCIKYDTANVEPFSRLND